VVSTYRAARPPTCRVVSEASVGVVVAAVTRPG
jgi:hypothetical protein